MDKTKSYLKYFIICIVIAAVTIVILMFNSGLLWIRPVKIATGSMEPEIKTGDIVIVDTIKRSEVQVGDIIQYSYKGTTVVHRVKKLTTNNNGTLSYITKGDSNNVEDSEPINYSAVIGKVVYTVHTFW